MGSIFYADATHIREQANVDANRIKQKGANVRRGAESALATFSQSLSNKKALDAAGREHDDIVTNAGRNLDSATYGRFQDRLAAAEELGATLAEASAAGVGGSTIEVYNDTIELNQAMREELAARNVKTATIASGAAASDAIDNGVSSMGNNLFSADLDYSEYVDHKKQGTLSRLVTLGTAAAATYFGGPQAGMAVLSASEAGQASRNGDFAGASRAWGSALNSASSAWGSVKAGATPAGERSRSRAAAARRGTSAALDYIPQI